MSFSQMLSLYHSLPHFMQNFVANVRGFQLRSWRYGNDFQRLKDEASERERWSVDEWRFWQEERLGYILHKAATQVPFYRDYWVKRRKSSQFSFLMDIENWPILEKDEVRKDPKAFIVDHDNDKHLFTDKTGGTTGVPTLIYETRSIVRKWYALSEARLQRWHGVDSPQWWGMFGGQKIIPLSKNKEPYWVKNAGLRQIYFSIYHISRDTAKHYYSALCKFNLPYFVVYPSVFAILAHHFDELGLKPPPTKVIFCNSEKVTQKQREIIQTVFDCPVVDTYGMAEKLSGASECDQGIMHYWPEVGNFELFDSDVGEFIRDTDIHGDFVLTSLLNETMPLIRYRNGDRGTLPDWSYKCGCNCPLPRFGKIDGRANDLIVTKDGRKLYILDSLFNDLPIVEGQLVQVSIDEFVVNWVPDHGFADPKSEKELKARLQDYLGNVEIQFVKMDQIPRNPNGKSQPFISRIR